MDNRIKKNANGGILVTPDEIKTAFQLLDVDGTGTVSIQHLKKRLGVLFPDMTAKDYRFLMNNKKELTVQDLNDLLLENEVSNFDPVAEAFGIFSEATAGKTATNPASAAAAGGGSGGLSGQRLREAFLAYGMGELADEELAVLIRTVDLDGDGVVSLEDFRSMIDPPATTSAVGGTQGIGGVGAQLDDPAAAPHSRSTSNKM